MIFIQTACRSIGTLAHSAGNAYFRLKKKQTKVFTKHIMHMLLHHLKVAVRNLMKYKLQTFISVLSIAIGIVTLAFAHAVLTKVTSPSLYSQPYADRTFNVYLEPIDGSSEKVGAAGSNVSPPSFNRDLLLALKRDGGPKSVERMAVPNGMTYGDIMEFRLGDSIRRKTSMAFTLTDPGYFNLMGIRSAITGRPVSRLKPGEAIISQKMAATVFGDADPRGAVCPNTNGLHPIPLTIVDVFEDVSSFEGLLNSRTLYISLGEMESDLLGAKNGVRDEPYHARWVTMVLREGCTESQLLQELNTRLKPFGLRAALESAVRQGDIRLIVTVQTLVHLIGALILMAALIGFLRMQVQLFWMRRREVSLHITHGARRSQLFRLLFAEVVIVVGLSVAVAMLMGSWVEHFVYTNFANLMNDAPFSVRNLACYSLSIGLLLLLLCALIIWVALARICRAEQGLAAHMRVSRTHLFRNVMLGLQVAISIVFVCGTLTTALWADEMLKSFNLPDNLEPYKECLYLRVDEARENCESLKKEIARQPSLDKMMAHETVYHQIPDIADNPEMLEAFGGQSHFPLLLTADTTLVDFYHLRVNWLRKPTGSEAYLLLADSLYHKMRRLGVVTSDVLTVSWWDEEVQAFPIAGTIAGMPYERHETSILVHPGAAERVTNFVLVPKDGKYRQLLRETEDVIQRVEPSVVDRMAHNFHAYHQEVGVVENFRIVGWMLGIVSLIICAMSIYSTIALDTRSRQKEVAIRQVCGAKSGDIYRLFGRVYVLMVVLSLLIAIPVEVLFHRMMFSEDMMSPRAFDGADTSPLIPCLGGAFIVIVLIVAIVGWNIRCIMRTNPSEIIAKE